MSQRARSVLRTIDLAAVVRDRHPVLFAEYLRAGRSCLQLARAIDRHRRRREPERREERYEGDREAERVEADWEDTVTERSRRHWDARRPEIDRDRRSRRQGLDVHELYRQLVGGLAEISTVAAGNPEPSRGAGGSAAPPRQQRLQDDPRWNGREAIVKRGLLLLLELVDEAKGHGVQPARDLTTEEMNRLVLTEGRGLSCKEAAAKFPEATDGKASVVARIRRMQGSDIRGQDVLGYRVSTIDGERVPDTKGAHVRRVQTG